MGVVKDVSPDGGVKVFWGDFDHVKTFSPVRDTFLVHSFPEVEDFPCPLYQHPYYDVSDFSLKLDDLRQALGR
jgi:hypothetical protein